VLSGNENVYPYAPKGTLSEQRFIAVFGEKGQFHLLSDVSDIRFRNAQGETAHARGFTADINHTDVVPKVSRKADGTAFFVINQILHRQSTPKYTQISIVLK
jgi:hypothetical protein